MKILVNDEAVKPQAVKRTLSLTLSDISNERESREERHEIQLRFVSLCFKYTHEISSPSLFVLSFSCTSSV